MTRTGPVCAGASRDGAGAPRSAAFGGALDCALSQLAAGAAHQLLNPGAGAIGIGKGHIALIAATDQAQAARPMAFIGEGRIARAQGQQLNELELAHLKAALQLQFAGLKAAPLEPTVFEPSGAAANGCFWSGPANRNCRSWMVVVPLASKTAGSSGAVLKPAN